MSSFNIRYFDAHSASIVEERVEASSEEQLQESCVGAGRVLLQVRRERTLRSRSTSAGVDVAGWCRELSTLLKAGMTVVEALETLQSQAKGEAREQIHARLTRSLREGQPLSRAMGSASVFPAVLVASVTASERTSTLTAALDDFLRYDEMIQRLRRQVVSAAIYPLLVVALGALIALFLLVYVIPRFSRMYVDFNGAISIPTQVLMVVSHAMTDHLPIVLAVMGGLFGLAVWAWRHGLVAAVAYWAIEAVEPLRRQWEHFRRASLYQSLALMFRGGYTLDEALSVCEGMNLGPRTGRGIALARAELAQGRTIVASFAKGKLADITAERLLGVGERSGSFDAVLQTIADRHAVAFATFVERTTRIVEPILLLSVALVIGGIVVMMYMPIFDIANGIR